MGGGGGEGGASVGRKCCDGGCQHHILQLHSCSKMSINRWVLINGLDLLRLHDALKH